MGDSGMEATGYGRLRAIQQEIGQQRTETFDVPGYFGQLVMRARWTDYKTVRAIQRRAEKARHDEYAELNAACDTIAAACDTLLFRNGDGELQDLGVGFDAEFAENMHFEIPPGKTPSARVVIKLTLKNDLALIAFANDVVTWLQSNESDVAEDVLGESPARPSSRTPDSQPSSGSTLTESSDLDQTDSSSGLQS